MFVYTAWLTLLILTGTCIQPSQHSTQYFLIQMKTYSCYTGSIERLCLMSLVIKHPQHPPFYSYRCRARN